MSDYRYIVTFEPNISIRPRRYVREITVRSPSPENVLREALKRLEGEDVDLWQSDDLRVRVEKVA